MCFCLIFSFITEGRVFVDYSLYRLFFSYELKNLTVITVFSSHLLVFWFDPD